MENNFLRLKCYYFNLFSVIFKPFKLYLDRNHHTEFYIKSVNINYFTIFKKHSHNTWLVIEDLALQATGWMNGLEMSGDIKGTIDVYRIDFQL